MKLLDDILVYISIQFDGLLLAKKIELEFRECLRFTFSDLKLVSTSGTRNEMEYK